MSLFDTFSKSSESGGTPTGGSSLYDSFTAEKGLTSRGQKRRYARKTRKTFEDYNVPKKTLSEKYNKATEVGGNLSASLVTGLGEMTGRIIDQALHLVEKGVEMDSYNPASPLSLINQLIPQEKKQQVADRIKKTRLKYKENLLGGADIARETNPMGDTFAGQTAEVIGGILPNIALGGLKTPVAILSISEAAMNAEDSYDENIAKGMEKKDAMKRALPQFATDLATTYILNKAGALGKITGEKGALIKIGTGAKGKIASRILETLKDGSLETLQEVIQTGLQNLATDKPFTQGMKETAKLMIIPSLFFGGVANFAYDGTEERKTKIKTEVKKKTEEVKQKVDKGEELTEEESVVYAVTEGKDPFVDEEIVGEDLTPEAIQKELDSIVSGIRGEAPKKPGIEIKVGDEAIKAGYQKPQETKEPEVITLGNKQVETAQVKQKLEAIAQKIKGSTLRQKTSEVYREHYEMNKDLYPDDKIYHEQYQENIDDTEDIENAPNPKGITVGDRVLVSPSKYYGVGQTGEQEKEEPYMATVLDVNDTSHAPAYKGGFSVHILSDRGKYPIHIQIADVEKKDGVPKEKNKPKEPEPKEEPKQKKTKTQAEKVKEAVKAGRKAVLIEKNKEVVETITKPRVEKALKEKKNLLANWTAGGADTLWASKNNSPENGYIVIYALDNKGENKGTFRISVETKSDNERQMVKNADGTDRLFNSLEEAVEYANTNEEMLRSKKESVPKDTKVSKSKAQKLQLEFENKSVPQAENEVPVKKDFGKATKNWLKALNEELGWEADTDKKGKVSSPDYNEGGWGIGGDVTGIFWKPGTDYGIYISVSGNLIDDENIEVGTILYRATRKDIKYKGYSNNYLPKEIATRDIAEVAEIMRETVDPIIEREALDRTAKRENTITDDKSRQKAIPDTSKVSARDDRESGQIADGEVSRYDRATDLVESGDGLGGEGASSKGIGKKGRQLINEEVEELLEAREYSTNPEDYTEEDRALMMNYTGAGGKESVGAEGSGLLNEYYTPVDVIEKVWDIAKALDPNIQRAFEPSVGTGRFISNSPVGVQVDGAEIQKVSGTIAKILHPESDIIIGDFQELFFDKKTNKAIAPKIYDAVIGNPPFGDRGGFLKGKGEESRINRQEEYFIKRGLDMTKEGGYLIYVVNSSFLKTGTSAGKESISKIGTLVSAYRLPENVFEDTSIGTDIVVFKKEIAKDTIAEVSRNMTIAEDRYFRSTLGANNILGDTKVRKNRFGQMETYVEGDLDSAMKKIVLPQQEVVKTEKINTEKVVKEKVVKEGTTKKQKAPKIVQTIEPKQDIGDSVVPVQSVSRKVEYSPVETEMLARITRDGTIPNPTSDEIRYLNYSKGDYIPDVLYYSGDIYARLKQLEIDKDSIIETLGEEQYDKQKSGLQSIIPEQVTIKDIEFDPLDRHVAQIKTKWKDNEMSLLGAFSQYIRFNEIALSPRVTKYDVLRYVQGERASKDSKPIMGSIRSDAKRLFNHFLKKELDIETQNIITDKYNTEKNSYVRPEFSMIPVEVKNMSKTFRGKDFSLSPVQKDGVGFLVNKGSGLIAYGVGVGKTHTLAVATVANMQKGWTKRPLFVVPKATITKTWINTLHEMFPDLTINNLGGLQADVVRRLKAQKGESVADWIKDGELTVISHEGILRLGFTEEELRSAAQDLKDALWAEEKTKRGEEKSTQKLDEIVGQAQKYVTDVMLQDLGFDHISVDEVHNFRKVFQGAKKEEEGAGGRKRYSNVIGGTPSKRAQQLFLLSQYVQKKNNNRNVFLASATPFENHATEVYNILSFVARDRMKEMGILNINDFFSVFSNFEVELDRKLDGTWIDREKMKSFANLPALQGLLREFIDYQEDETLVRPERRVITPQLQMSEKQEDNLMRIQSLLKGEKPPTQEVFDEESKTMFNVADDVEEGAFLKASTYSIANSVSPYFIKEYTDKKPTKEQLIEESPKIKYSMEVLKKVKDNPKTKDYGTFLFFGKMGVEYHPMIKDYIVENLGYDANEVAVLSGNIDEDVKEDIKEKFNNGQVKVLIGGDQTKEGIDLQENGFITINLALGWNPTQISQVEGRVWRQGNKRNIAPLIYPLVENSGDAIIYNKFEEKGGRINDLFSYRGKIFDVGEIDPAEKKLALMTDPKDKANMQIEIDKTKFLNEIVLLESDKNELKKLLADKTQTEEDVVYYTDVINEHTDKESEYGKNRLKEYKKNLKSAKDRLVRIEQRIVAKNLTDIGESIKELDVKIEELNKKVKEINETYEQKLAYYTELQREEIKNRKTIPEMMSTIDELIGELEERTQEEIDSLRAEKVKAYNEKRTLMEDEDVASMANFVVAEQEVMDKMIESDLQLERIREHARQKRDEFEIKRGRDFLLAQLQKSAHRKLYANVRLAMGTEMSETEMAELERKMAFDIPVEEAEAVAYLVNRIPELMFDELGTRVTRNATPTPGRYSFSQKVMEISTKLIAEDGGKYSRTIIHELWHHLSQYLPDADVATIKKDYARQTAKYVKENKWFAKYHIDTDGKEAVVTEEELKSLEKEYPEVNIRREFKVKNVDTSGRITYSPQYTAENYRYKNIDEWFAELMADRSVKYIADTSVETKSVWYHMKRIMQMIAESIQRAFGFDRAGRFLNDFMTGKNTEKIRDVSLVRGDSSAMDFMEDLNELNRNRLAGFDDFAEKSKDYSVNLRRKDINVLNETLAQSRDLYLSDPVEFKQADQIMKVGDERRMKKSILDKKMATILKPYFDMKPGERTRVDQTLIQGDKDGVEYSEMELKSMHLNPEQQNAYKAVRRAFNSAHAILLEEMRVNGVKEEEIAEFEKERRGYLPHKWKYRFAIKTQILKEGADPAQAGSWKTDSIDVFKTARLADKEFAKRKEENKDENVRFVNDTLDSLEVDFFTEQRFSFENMKSVISKAKTSADVKDELLRGLRDMIKEKGFGRHFIKRTGIEGYEQKEIPEVIANYMTGLTGFITKMEAGKKYYEVLEQVDARRQKRFYAWLRNSIAYDMGQTKEWNTLKEVGFIWHLSNDLSFLLTNMTQNWTVGIGELSKLEKGTSKIAGAEATLVKATADWALGNISQDEKDATTGLISLGRLGGEMTAELMGFKNNPLYRSISGGFNKALYASTSFVEQNVNRVPAFLAARRILAKNNPSFTNAELNEQALSISDDIHFRYGKQHRPEFMRGRKGSIFIFNHYLRSYMYQLARDMKQKEFVSLSKKMFYLFLLAGVSGLPFAKLIKTIVEKLFGADTDEDTIKELKSWELVLQRGLPASFLNIDLSGKVGADIMAISNIMDAPGDIKSYLGALGNLFFDRFPKGVELLKEERYLEGFGKLLPDVLGNPLRAYNGVMYGVKSQAGNPLMDENGEPFKYTTLEGIIKAIGYTPTREQLAWDEQSRQWVLEQQLDAEGKKLRDQIDSLIKEGKYDEARRIEAEGKTSGALGESKDYVSGAVKDAEIEKKLSAWNSGTKSQSLLDSMERDIARLAYGQDYTPTQLTNVTQEFGFRRYFGYSNQTANDIFDASTNKEKLEILQQARRDMGETAFKAFFEKGRTTVRYESGRTGTILISDQLRDLYFGY